MDNFLDLPVCKACGMEIDVCDCETGPSGEVNKSWDDIEDLELMHSMEPDGFVDQDYDDFTEGAFDDSFHIGGE